MAVQSKNLREEVFIKLPEIIDDTLRLPELTKVNDLVLTGYKLISVNQSKLNTGEIGIIFWLGKDEPTEHPLPFYTG